MSTSLFEFPHGGLNLSGQRAGIQAFFFAGLSHFSTVFLTDSKVHLSGKEMHFEAVTTHLV